MSLGVSNPFSMTLAVVSAPVFTTQPLAATAVFQQGVASNVVRNFVVTDAGGDPIQLSLNTTLPAGLTHSFTPTSLTLFYDGIGPGPVSAAIRIRATDIPPSPIPASSTDSNQITVQILEDTTEDVVWVTAPTVQSGQAVTIATHTDGRPLVVSLRSGSPALPTGASLSGAQIVTSTGLQASQTNDLLFTADDGITISTLTVGRSGSMFTYNGVATFIQGIESPDFLEISDTDLDFFQNRGFNMMRVWARTWSGGPATPIISSTGVVSNIPAARARITAAAQRGIVTLIVIDSWDAVPFQTNLNTAVTNIVNALKDLKSIIWDIVNDHNHNGTAFDNHTTMTSAANAMLAADPTAIFTVSSCGDHTHFFDVATGNVLQPATVAAEVAVGIRFADPHTLKSSDWYSRSQQRVAALRTQLDATGNSTIPAVLFGENRRNGAGPQSTELEFLQAALGCKNGGGAGWVFNTDAGFNMAGGVSFQSGLDSVELAVMQNLSATLAGGTSFVLTDIGRSGAQYWGVNDHFGQSGYASSVATVSQRVRDLNARVIRDGTKWDQYEVSPGVFGSPLQTDVFSAFANHAAASYDIFYCHVAAYFWNPIYASDATPLTEPAFRQLFRNQVKSICNTWLSQGRAANRLIICVGNESNENSPFGEYGIDWQDGTGVQNYGVLCKEIRADVRAINTAIRVQVGGAANGSFSGYNTWHANLKATPQFWSQALDIFDSHEYSVNYPTLATPEEMYTQFKPFFQQIITEAAANARPDITTAISECGYDLATISDAEQTKRYSRLPFLWSVTPGLEFVHLYALRDTSTDFELLDPALNIFVNRGIAVRDAFAHVNRATDRRAYAHANGDTAVVMAVPSANGGQCVAVWNRAGRTMTGLQCVSSQAGTLNIQTIAGTTTTTPLIAGSNLLPAIALTDTAKVLHATNTVLSFPQLPLPVTGGGIRESDWIARSTAPLVTFASDFRNADDFISSGTNGGHVFAGGLDPVVMATVVKDTTDGLTGGCCLRIDVPSTTANGSAAWICSMNRNWTTKTQGMGNNAFWIQFRFKIPASRLVLSNVTSQYAWKWLNIAHYSPTNTSGESASNRLDEHVLQDTDQRGFPQAYHRTTAGTFPPFEDAFGAFDFNKQNMVDNGAQFTNPQDRYCIWTNSGATYAGCHRFFIDEWMTFKVRIKVGTYGGTAGNEFDMWYARQNATAWDHTHSFRNYDVGPPGEFTGGLNGLWFLTFESTRTSSSVSTWHKYDQIIVSMADIPLPAVGA